MSNLEINQLLSQLRATQARIDKPAALAGVEGTPAAGSDFGALLKESVAKVDAAKQTAAAAAADFEAGAPGADLTDVMLKVQKADLSFRAMTEVRNKLVNAYQEIMNMPV